MQKFAIGGAFALGLLAATGSAMAQTTTTTVTTLRPEQRTVVQEYVYRERRPSVVMENYEVRPGVVLPPTVQVYPVPQANPYSYTIINGTPVVVEPSTRQVIEVLR